MTDVEKGSKILDAGQARPAEAGRGSSGPRKRRQTEIISRRVADIVAKQINWLWPGRIACGKITDLSGDPGLGKSQITAAIAAVVTTGGQWPVDGTRCEPGAVVFLSAEDGVSDTIRPRLEAAGANLERCHVIEAIHDGFTADGDKFLRAPNLRRDLTRLEKFLGDIPDVALVVIDPVSAYVGDINSHNNAEVRGLLAPLATLAERLGIAVLVVNHLNKGSGSAIQRVNGSIAFIAAARAAFVVVADPEDPDRRLFLPSKNNLARDRGGLGYRIETRDLPGGISTSCVSWEDTPVNMSADAALAAVTNTEEPSALAEAERFLVDLLAEGPVLSKLVRANAQDAGHHWRTIERASKALGIETYRQGGVGAHGAWYWRLPLPNTAKKDYLRQPQDMAEKGTLGGHSTAAPASETPADAGTPGAVVDDREGEVDERAEQGEEGVI